MRICRYERDHKQQFGFYAESGIVPLTGVAGASGHAELCAAKDTLELLPGGALADAAREAEAWVNANNPERIPLDRARLLAPVTPSKIMLLAGNYAAHIEEEGSIALERAETFPYLFMKPSNTVNHPNAPIIIPSVSPDHIDYECELGVIIGRTASRVSESDALDYVAGYTVVNDISDRKYKPFPNRKAREKDNFFDWLHGKWHDGFCPLGPCVTSASTIPDPQALNVTLRVNGDVRQQGPTAQMIFPVAAIIEFISRAITLQPGDIIATGTPAGVGMTTGTFLQPGDTLDATVEGIGTLHNVMAAQGQ